MDKGWAVDFTAEWETLKVDILQAHFVRPIKAEELKLKNKDFVKIYGYFCLTL